MSVKYPELIRKHGNGPVRKARKKLKRKLKREPSLVELMMEIGK